MDSDTGITIQSGRDITIAANENMNLITGDVTDYDKKYEEGLKILESRHKEGADTYQAESGDPAQSAVLWDAAKDFAKTQGKNGVDILKGMVMFDFWKGLFTKEEEPEVPPEAAQIEQGVATLYGYETVILQVDKSVITMDTNIHISADTFKWLGYNQREHEAEELPLQDWWETVLDGAQFVLDIAGCIPFFGAVPDLINAGISLMRGNFAEAAMSAVAAIPLVGDAAGAAKVAGKGIKLATKTLTKAERIVSVLQGLYVSAQAAFAIYQMKDQLADLYQRWKDGENIFANPGDVSLLLNLAGSGTMAIRGVKGIGEGLTGKKVGLTYDGDPEYANGNHNQKTTDCGDPINVVTGSFGMNYTDLQLRDVRETFFLKRIYESVYQNKGMMLGSRWFLNIESRLIQHKEKVQVQLPDMKLLEFEQTEYGFENSRNQSRSWQLNTTSEGYLLKNNPEKKEYAYDKQGRLTAIADRFHNNIRFHYENGYLVKMTTESGQKLTFAYDKNHLASITTGDGRKLCYEYDGDLLTKVILANESSICYEYDQNGNIHSITDQNENTYVTNEYDRKGRVVKQTTATGGEYILFYDEKNRRTTFTDIVTGEQTIYEYNRDKNVTKTTYSDGTTEENIYDQWENCILEKDRNGNETKRSYDIYGNLITEQLPSGLITENEYDVHNQRVRQTDNAGREVTWTYDKQGCLVAEAILLAPGKWSSMAFEYDSFGRITKETNPNGNVIEYAYEKFSEPVRRTYPEGETTWFEYDAAGRCLREKNEKGKTDYTYNRTDCLTEIKDRDGNTIRFGYDFLGNRTSIVTPELYGKENGRIDICYDVLDNINRVVTAEGNVYQYQIGVDGRVLKAVHPNAYHSETKDGEGMTFDYDETGRRIRVHHPDGGCERYYIDGNGNILKKIAPEQYNEKTDDGAGNTYEYDSANRLIKITDPYGNVQQAYIYDLTDNVVKVIDARGYLTADNDDERIGTHYTYNLAGWMTSKREPLRQDADNVVYYKLTCYRYDNMGNLIEEKRFLDEQSLNSRQGKTHTITYTYDKSNRLTEISDSTGAAIRYTYDKTGYRTSEKIRVGEEVWKETRYEYSPAGKMLKRMVRLKEEQTAFFSLTENAKQEQSIYSDFQTEEAGQKQNVNLSSIFEIGGRSTDKNSETTSRNAENRIDVHARKSDWAVTEYTYDKNGNITKIKMPEGGCYYYEYDRDDRLIKERHVEENGEIQNQITYTYDAAGNRTTVTDVNGNKTEYEYDLQNQQTAILTPDGGRTRNVYDKNGNLVRKYTPMQMAEAESAAITEVNTSKIGITPDALETGKIEKAVCAPRTLNPSVKETQNRVAAEKAVNISALQTNAKCWKYTYDFNNRLVETITPEGTLLNSFRYDIDGQLSSTADALGSGIHLTYDLAGRRTFAKTTGGSTQTYCYDAFGNIIGLTDGLSNRTEFILDNWGRITGIQKPDGTVEQYTYDYMGNLLSSQDGEGNLVNFRYDLNGNMTTRIDQLGNREYFGYDKENRLVSMIDRNGNQTRITYNMYGSITSRIATGADQSSTVTETYGYYPDGKLRYAIGGGMRYNYVYDIMGRLSQKNASGKTLLSNEYDLNGNRIAMTDLTGKRCEYHYNSLEQLEEVIDNGTSQVRYHYNADGTISRMEVGAGLITEYTYDTDKNVISQKTVMMGANAFLGVSDLQGANSLQREMQGVDSLQKAIPGITKANGIDNLVVSGGKTITNNLGKAIDISRHTNAQSGDAFTQQSTQQSLVGNLTSVIAMNQRDRSKPYTLVDNTYAYDANGNRTSKQTLAGLTTYAYDASERLIKVNYPTGSEEYRYDKAGNRIEKLTNGNTTERYQYDAKNRLVSQDILSLRADGTTEHKAYTYDEQGNMLTDGTRNFAYDAMNRLSQVTTTEGNTQKNRYDGEGLRAEMEENGRLVNFLFDGEKVIAETDGDQNVIRYIRGYDLISSDSEKAKTYYHYASDEMGSITHVIDEAGNVCNHYEYDVYGDFTVKEETIQNRFGFTGEQFDPVAGLYYLRARFYNPVIGRFIQEDTYYGDGLNLYTYCANNPVKYVDPSGHEACLQKQEAINKLKEAGLSPEEAENYYNHLRESNGGDAEVLALPAPTGTNPWMDGTEIIAMEAPENCYINMALAPGQNKPGGWGTFDNIPDVDYVRNNLAVTPEFKPEIGYVQKYKIPKGTPIQIGIVGPQKYNGIIYFGGGNQVQILNYTDRANLIPIGTPYAIY